ncbi:MAG: DEAD/DEAH box helicase family protein [Imperialibacter sp.]|uniref:TOTE conflict system archaeo-eukaryotic primase domain-containing protein n=1 Tax=Imperialibacter sp. TaxID=2038411 RepID=UPI0032F05A6E
MDIIVPSDKQIDLFRSLFKVREDVFAIRWVRGAKKGYMPAYQYDPHMYRLHKMKGGTLHNYADKFQLPLTKHELVKHFAGEQHIGGYPLLQDNTSWFIAADFDGKQWEAESQKLVEICLDKNIPAYLERSRSGNGGHVWIFFDRAYPAVKSRKVFKQLMEGNGILSIFDKSSSFDRLFPNQDFHSGKGLGNLIALPFHGASLKNNNSCFLDPQTLRPFDDQWLFLTEIKRVETTHLDRFFEATSQEKVQTASTKKTSGKLEISLDGQLHISRSGLTYEIINYLKDELNITNSEYFIKKKAAKSTWDTKRYFKLTEDKEFEVIVPRGFTGKLLKYLKSHKVDYEFRDLRIKREPVLFQFPVKLLAHQETVMERVKKKEFGVIVAPPGSGKTIIGLHIIAEKQQPAIILVHRKQIAEQWIERIQAFLKIPKAEIGLIGLGKAKSGSKVTVGMIQSLSKKLNTQPDLVDAFGTVIIDECHHIPAGSYSGTISKLNPYYQYGLTATPFRKYSDGQLIFIHLGNIIAEIEPNEIESFKRARIIIRKTNFEFPFNPKTDPFETLSKVLIHDTARNRLITNDVISEARNGSRSIVITERKEHIEALNQLLKQSCETITLSGEDAEKQRQEKWKPLKSGNYQVLITTGQYFGEGSDLHNATRLFLVYPFSFKGKLIQYIGRVQRSEITPVIYDYHDHKIGYLHRLFLKRNVLYRNMDKQASLFDKPDGTITFEKDLIIDKDVKVQVDILDFQYGFIAFKHLVPEMNRELYFEIENLNIRPEFDILKSYFSKVLNTKTISIHIYAEFQDRQLLAQDATSSDLERINREIIDSVKFRFIEKRFLKKNAFSEGEGGLLDLEQVRSDTPFYSSEEDLFNDLLENQKVKHFRQLKYLASRHERSVLKLRFVLAPFSFVFLLSGKEQFHLIMETLDTEEATYIWHFEKDIQMLKLGIREVDQHLEVIRNKGRQVFLEYQPHNFSRVVHDYSDERKGFVVWKDQLEERLV